MTRDSAAPRLGKSDALIVVDVQRDFCPGGALPVPRGDEVVPVLNAWMERAARAGATVVVSRDWHPPGHVSFVDRGGPYPEHCVQGSWGARFHDALRLPSDYVLISKGQEPDRDALSAFDGTGLGALLEDRGVHRVFVGGLAQEICVRATVLDALRYGFATHVLTGATPPIDAREGEKALEEMRDNLAVLEPAHALPADLSEQPGAAPP